MKTYTILIDPSDPERESYTLDYSFTDHKAAIEAAKDTIKDLRLGYDDHTEIITKTDNQGQIVAFELWQYEDVFQTSVRILTTNLIQKD